MTKQEMINEAINMLYSTVKLTDDTIEHINIINNEFFYTINICIKIKKDKKDKYYDFDFYFLKEEEQ